MGREAGCELLATKTVLAEASRAIYSHCAVIEAPSDLPNGEYEVEFAGEVAIVTLREGMWTVGRLLPHTYSEAASFFAAGSDEKHDKEQVGRHAAKKVQRRELPGPARP